MSEKIQKPKYPEITKNRVFELIGEECDDEDMKQFLFSSLNTTADTTLTEEQKDYRIKNNLSSVFRKRNLI